MHNEIRVHANTLKCFNQLFVFYLYSFCMNMLSINLQIFKQNWAKLHVIFHPNRNASLVAISMDRAFVTNCVNAQPFFIHF